MEPIKVALRIRPLNTSESASNEKVMWQVKNNISLHIDKSLLPDIIANRIPMYFDYTRPFISQLDQVSCLPTISRTAFPLTLTITRFSSISSEVLFRTIFINYVLQTFPSTHLRGLTAHFLCTAKLGQEKHSPCSGQLIILFPQHQTQQTKLSSCSKVGLITTSV